MKFFLGFQMSGVTGLEFVQAMQLALEHDPHSFFNAGSSEKISREWQINSRCVSALQVLDVVVGVESFACRSLHNLFCAVAAPMLMHNLF